MWINNWCVYITSFPSIITFHSLVFSAPPSADLNVQLHPIKTSCTVDYVTKNEMDPVATCKEGNYSLAVSWELPEDVSSVHNLTINWGGKAEFNGEKFIPGDKNKKMLVSSRVRNIFSFCIIVVI